MDFDPSKLRFYMYGAHWCPVCRRMRERIMGAYGGDALVYYELEGNERNSALFSELHRMVGIGGIPTTAVFYNGKIIAVVEGAFEVKKVQEMVEEATREEGVLLFLDAGTYLVDEGDAERLGELFLVEE